jgi:hypothetical protein
LRKRRAVGSLVMDGLCAWWKTTRSEEAMSGLAFRSSWSPVGLKRSTGD